MIDTCTFACRMSGDTSTYVTVTPSTRGSRRSVSMAMLTTSRMASAAFRTRRDDISSRERGARSRECGGKIDFLLHAPCSPLLAVKLPLNFFHLVNFEQVTFLDVVESGQLDAAFITFANLLGIILLAAERI